MRVRALQQCFVDQVLRDVGDEFNAPEGTVMRTGKRPPVMEPVVDKAPDQPKKRGRPEKAATDVVDE